MSRTADPLVHFNNVSIQITFWSDLISWIYLSSFFVNFEYFCIFCDFHDALVETTLIMP